MRFHVTEENFKIVGRTLYENETRYLGFSGSSISFRFTGKTAKACIWTNAEEFGDDLRGRIAVYIDGGEQPMQRICLDETEKIYTLYESEEEKTVMVTVMKYSEAAFGKCGIRYIETDTDDLLDPPAASQRRLEIIGDSITCGYGVEAPDENTPFHTATENPTLSYSMLTAKELGADAQLVSWSGNGIISGYVEETATEPSDKWLMPEVYRYTDISTSDTLHKDCEEKWEKWDFSRFVPQMILVNLGTNDCSWCKDILERKEQYRDEYVKFLRYIRQQNPDAQILCMLGTMDNRVLKQLEEAVTIFSKNDSRVHFLALPAQNPEDGYGADFHPCPYTHRYTAELVAAEIKKIMNW